MKRKTYIADRRNRSLLILVIAAVSLVFSVGSFAGETYREEKSETIEFQGEKSISISVKKGNVKVTGEKDRKNIYYVFTKKVKGVEEEDARKLASLINIVVERDGDELIIRTEIPKKFPSLYTSARPEDRSGTERHRSCRNRCLGRLGQRWCHSLRYDEHGQSIGRERRCGDPEYCG